jgi:hypothetical protein
MSTSLAFLIIKMNIIWFLILGMNGAHLIIRNDVWNKTKQMFWLLWILQKDKFSNKVNLHVIFRI